MDHRYPETGPDVPCAVDFLRVLAVNENQLILFTMRSGDELENAVEWFSERELPLMGINQNPDQLEWTSSPKAYAHFYIDDAAVGCPLIQPPGFERECVDWRSIAELLGYDDSIFE